MILGRRAALWTALVAAALNALVLVVGIPLSGEQVAVLNVLAGCIVALVANEQDPTLAYTAGLQGRIRTRLSGDSSSVTGSSSTSPDTVTGDTLTGTSTDPTGGGPAGSSGG